MKIKKCYYLPFLTLFYIEVFLVGFLARNNSLVLLVLFISLMISSVMIVVIYYFFQKGQYSFFSREYFMESIGKNRPEERGILLEAKYAAFKEIANLIAHDLSGSLHVMKFCGEELAPHVSGDASKFLDRLNGRTQKIDDLINSLRTLCKEDEIHKVESYTSYGNRDNPISHKGEQVYLKINDAYRRAICFLRIKFWSSFKLFDFVIDKEISEKTSTIHFEDLVMLFYEIMKELANEFLVDAGETSRLNLVIGINSNGDCCRFATKTDHVQFSLPEDSLLRVNSILDRYNQQALIERENGSFCISFKFKS